MESLFQLDWVFIAESLGKTLGIIFLVVLPMVSYTVYAERRISALIQDRLGPNRVGIPFTNLRMQGLGQPIADAMKFLLKEELTPAHVNKFYFWLAPGLAMVPALLTLAVIPFGSTVLGVPMVIANVNIGILFVFAVASLGVYGIVLAGWASNSKYSFLGGVRSSSQMLSYELSLGLSVVPIFLLLGKLNLVDIVSYQAKNGWLLLPFWGEGLSLRRWLLLAPMLVSFVIFTISIFAETNRLPFDMPECETELVAGYHTEYSSMKFALFFLGEYAAMITGSSLIVTLFLGGWHLPLPWWSAGAGFHFALIDGSAAGLAGILGGLFNIVTFFGKVAVLLGFFIWVRWTLPRFRYDQLMRLGWIFFFEIALVNIFVTAGILLYLP